MAKELQPLVIDHFSTGLYTHRSQLFSPYRSVGVNVVTYHDAAIDGQDMELSTTLEWVRRPGFSRFCPVAFGATEIPLQFYSSRQPSGNVFSFVDTTQFFSIFSSTSLTKLFAKNTTAQGFIQQIGAYTYYANGVDFKKWAGTFIGEFPPAPQPTLSAWGTAAPTAAPTITMTRGNVWFWQPGTNFPNYGALQPTILDSNGNIEFLGVNGNTGQTAPIWNVNLRGLTHDGDRVTGSSWNNDGPLLGWAPSTAFIGPTVIADSNGNLQFLTTAGTSGTTNPTWATTAGTTTTDGTAVWSCQGSVASVGATVTQSGTVTIQAGYVWGYAYRTIWGHLSTCSPLSYPTGPGIGPFSVTIGGVGTADPQCTQVLPIANIAINNNVLTVTFGAFPVNLVPGQSYTFSGVTTAAFLNGQTVIVSTVNQFFPGGTFTAPFNHANYASAPDTGSASFNGIEIYRTADGGGLLYFDSSLPTTGAGVSWSFVDTNSDAVLVTSLIAPLNHLNDPPPGTMGSLVKTGGTILAYWQGRIWMAVGNKLYFNAGPDCTNGVPEESWPPANVFQYAGNITGLAPTSQGLLVWISDHIAMALGGPQTLSFFPYNLMQNFGVSSPNCLFHDGDNLAVLTTSKQCFMIDVSGRSETGNYIANLIQATYDPVHSYIAIHRQGTDAGLWVADGSINAFRYSLNVGCWSTNYKPVGGMGALKSVETSVGTMTLCAGRPTGGGYILGRDSTTRQDDGQNYTNCFVTIGNIVLSPPGSPLVPVEHIVGYFDAVGQIGGGPSVPSIAILPNEISALVATGNLQGTGFITLSDPVSEYTTAAAPSQTLQSWRWPVDSMNSGLASQWMHHIQIRITFAPENARNTIKTLAIMFKKDA